MLGMTWENAVDTAAAGTGPAVPDGTRIDVYVGVGAGAGVEVGAGPGAGAGEGAGADSAAGAGTRAAFFKVIIC